MIKVSTNYLDYMALMDTFNKIVKEMKDSDEEQQEVHGAAVVADSSGEYGTAGEEGADGGKVRLS